MRRTWLVECQVIKAWHFSGFAFSALLFVFKIAWKSSALSFSALDFANVRILLLLLIFLFKSLAGCHAYFLCSQLCKHQNSFLIFLLLISTTDFEKVASCFPRQDFIFSSRNWLHSLSFRSFRNNFIFRYMPSQKAITMSSPARRVERLVIRT